MRSFLIIPFHKIINFLECETVVVICFEPFLNFAVALRMFYAAKYLLNAVGIKELFEPRVAVDNVGGELAAVVANALLDFAVFECELHTSYAFI